MVGKVEPSPEREAAWQVFCDLVSLGGALFAAEMMGAPSELTNRVAWQTFQDSRALIPNSAARRGRWGPLFDLWWSEREAGGKT